MALLRRVLECKCFMITTEPIGLHPSVGDFPLAWIHRRHAIELCPLSPCLPVEFNVDAMTIDVGGKECFTHFLNAARWVHNRMITVDLALLVFHHRETAVALLQHRPADIVDCVNEARCFPKECTDVCLKGSDCRRVRFTKNQRLRIDYLR